MNTLSEERIPPYMMVWHPEIGEFGAFVPTRGIARLVAGKYTAGMGYLLEPATLGSTPFERAFFASVNTAWQNLSDDRQREEYPTPDHLRKRALIKCGFHRTSEIVFDTDKDARRAAATAKLDDEYCVVVVSGNVMRKYVAESMKVRTKQDRERFKLMADAVLQLLAATLGTTKKELEREGQK